MNPYRDALRKKKFEGFPVDEQLEEEQQAAATGDAAPSIREGEMANSQEVAALGEMDESLPLNEEDLSTFVENAEATPGIEDLTSEEVFGVSAPMGRPKTLTERVQQSLKKRK